MIKINTFVLLAATALSVLPASAAQVMMCAPEVSGAAAGPRQVGGTGSPVPSQALYNLNGIGCALIASGDVGYFLSQGYVQASSQTTIAYTTGVATGTTNFVIGTLPANAYIQKIVFQNTTANAAGNVALGSTAAGVDIVAAVALGANAIIAPTIALAQTTTGAAATLNLSSSAWGNANVTVSVIFGYY